MIGSDFYQTLFIHCYLKLKEMSTTRKLPDSDIARKKALNKALDKMESLDPADNLLSPETSARLIIAAAKYNDGFKAITVTSSAYHLAVAIAKPQRILLRTYVRSYFASLKANIKIAKIPKSARAFYGLDVTNTRQPNIASDDTLLMIAEMVIKGDAFRIADGGIAMSVPTMAEFMDIYDVAKPIIHAISNTATAANLALSNLIKQEEDVDDLIVHIWNEVEAKYSKSKPTNRRVQCRLWGVRYISRGAESVVNGVCIDSITNLPLPNVKLYLAGVGKKSLSDADGKYNVNTTLYGDLELIATLPGYEQQTIDFNKENCVDEVMNVMMVKIL